MVVSSWVSPGQPIFFLFSPRQWKDHPFHPDCADAGAVSTESICVAIVELNINSKSSIIVMKEYTYHKYINITTT